MIISILADLFFIDSYFVNLGLFFFFFFGKDYLKSVCFEKTNLWCCLLVPFSVFQLINFCF